MEIPFLLGAMNAEKQTGTTNAPGLPSGKTQKIAPARPGLPPLLILKITQW